MTAIYSCTGAQTVTLGGPTSLPNLVGTKVPRVNLFAFEILRCTKIPQQQFILVRGPKPDKTLQGAQYPT